MDGRVARMLPEWCEEWLGSPVATVLFEAGHLSTVVGVELADGRQVVVKVRPWEPRLQACDAVHRHLWGLGFPCPRPLAELTRVAGEAVSAEALVPGGDELPSGGGTAELFARLLARLVAAAPPPESLASLDPPAPWLWGDHPGTALWPRADDTDADLNAATEPAWLDEMAAAVRARLRASALPAVVGHGDWRRSNLRWSGPHPMVVHDWDSVVALPEPVIAGAAALSFPNDTDATTASVAECAVFLAAYAAARKRPWSPAELEVCWAAGLWVFAFNAKKESLAGAAGGPMGERLRGEAAQRLRLAGCSPSHPSRR